MLLPNGSKCRFTVPAEAGAGNILHFMLPGYQAGVLVRMFSAEDIMLSSGSACQSESDEPSAVLQALNYSKSDAYSGIRVSLSGENTREEAEIFVQKLQQILQDY
jgi:cysteine desulfurase